MHQDDALDEELANRRAGQGENRVVPTVAVLVALVAYALLPDELLFAPRFAIPAVESPARGLALLAGRER